jgi:hypothetical protein
MTTSMKLHRTGVLALIVALLTLPSMAAEITCLENYGPGATQINPVRLAEAYPSGRRPSPDTCRKVLIPVPYQNDLAM